MNQPTRKTSDLIDTKSFHELLYDHQSQDFKKSRRNLMVIAFIIISVWLLGLDLENLKIFGLNLDRTPGKGKIPWIGIILISYWWIMFEIYRKRDKDIHVLHQKLVRTKINDLEVERRENF